LQIPSKLTLALAVLRVDLPQFLQVAWGDLVSIGSGAAGLLPLLHLGDKIFLRSAAEKVPVLRFSDITFPSVYAIAGGIEL
jgi:hypothetical protein